jgi:DNA polymerase III delta subunit
MIYIVHGDDYPHSRNMILNQLKKLEGSSRNEINISDTTPTDLQTMCCSFDIFGNPPFIVLDISGAGRMNMEEYVKSVSKTPKETTLVILSSKELSKTNPFLTNAVKLKAKIILNQLKPTSNVFRFIDNVYSGRRDQSYKELRTLLIEKNDPFYLFSMLLYGLRTNYGKLREENVNKLFKELYEIDKGSKTGDISPDVMIVYSMEKVFNAGKRN